ncbi:hypothetical protein [Sphaerotilus sp.]|uniref:hypothetical protein n=1 Tax=Sphaerotilus sp. TaxID=2093942 RepID=UPI0034E27E1F
MKNTKFTCAAACALALLSACGGGGGDAAVTDTGGAGTPTGTGTPAATGTPSAAVTPTVINSCDLSAIGNTTAASGSAFPVRAAFQRLTANGYQIVYGLKGTSSGGWSYSNTYRNSMTSPVAGLLQGVPVLMAVETFHGSIGEVGGIGAFIVYQTNASNTDYFDTQCKNQLGWLSNDQGLLCIGDGVPTFPETAVDGQTGASTTYSCYKDKTATTKTDKWIYTYSAKANLDGTLSYTSIQENVGYDGVALNNKYTITYKITKDGTVTPVSMTLHEGATNAAGNVTSFQ